MKDSLFEDFSQKLSEAMSLNEAMTMGEMETILGRLGALGGLLAAAEDVMIDLKTDMERVSGSTDKIAKILETRTEAAREQVDYLARILHIEGAFKENFNVESVYRSDKVKIRNQAERLVKAHV